MSNTLNLIPSVIAAGTVDYLASKKSLIKNVYTEAIPQARLAGGSTISVVKPASIFTPTDVNYSASASAQAITLPATTVNITTHKETKIALTDLELVQNRGGMDLILSETVPAIVDGLLKKVEGDIGALYGSAGTTIGTYNGAIDDATLRSGVTTLQNANVDLQMQNVAFITTPKGYSTDLMGIDRYVTVLNTDTKGTVSGGVLPRLYNIKADISNSITTGTISSTAVAYSLLFEKYGFCAGFQKFDPVATQGQNAPVEEYIVTDPGSGITIRFQKYFDPTLRTWFLQADIRYGVAVLDANRIVAYLHKNS
jgi:hypothetical protein